MRLLYMIMDLAIFAIKERSSVPWCEHGMSFLSRAFCTYVSFTIPFVIFISCILFG